VMQPLERVITALDVHGCNNVTALLELSAPAMIPVAQGGFGDVFCRRLRSGGSVAIKTLRVRESDDLTGLNQKRAARELYIWSKCKHPNLVRLMGLAVLDNTIAMVSRWEENGNLMHYLLHNPLADRYQLSTGISAGVAYIHENGIVHGDIKRTNVLVAQDGTPMLMDFGSAHLVGGDLQFQDNEPDPGQTTGSTLHQEQSHVASAIGSHAPELLSGEVEGTTTASDVYSLAMGYLQETFTSTIPFIEKKSDHAVMIDVAIHRKTPTRPQKDIPEGRSSKCGRRLEPDGANHSRNIEGVRIKPEESEIELEEGQSEQEIA
ncbi:hypothetical protein FRC11_008183, partial [Ceratobasidium sp. 423]